ncbi:uncharacterized protein SAPINGB_P000826 [Magnusiomyces paraingens]|uniref:Proteasome assembly chaperone 1 n=1 Tax=Magnusiomyces paraingens TaxID=2606893 RepID=A0A5E8BA14_9ASCO|nr:uncharacterized protein SAPINGB_P000826 [Saprochaete ingens]VVT45652.1 unnamed protein product [Saprochaete ingens]
MIFKPWAEFPPPRHLLDDQEDADIEDPEPATFSATLSPAPRAQPISRLVVVASRLVPLFRAYESASVAYTVSLTASLPKSLTESLDEDDDDDDGTFAPESRSPFVLKLPILQIDSNTLLLPLAPGTPVPATHELAAALGGLANETIVLAATGGAAGSGRVGGAQMPVASLISSAAANSPLLLPGLAAVPPLSVPESLQGAPAAILARAELENRRALALVVAGEGPVDHEQVDSDGLLALAYLVKTSLGLQQTQSTLPSQSSRMYL